MLQTTEFRAFTVIICTAAVLVSIGSDLNAAEPTGELAGVVSDLDGHPVAKAKVWLERRSATPIASTETSADGRFHLGPRAPIFRENLLVDAPGFGLEHRENISIFPNAVNEIRIVVAPGRTVQVRILKIDGRPAAHVPVKYDISRIVTGRYLSMPIGPDGQVTTDSEGEFRVDHVPPSRFTIDVRLPGMAFGWLYDEIQPGSGVQRLRTLRLAPDVPISGVVHDSHGKPLANIPVATDFANSPIARSDAAGRFVLRGFPAEEIHRVDVVISTPGFAYKRVPVGKRPAHVEIALMPQRWISGRVVDADTGAPVAIMAFIICSFTRRANGEIDRGNCRPIAFEQAQQGQFRVAYREPNNIHITIRAQGYDDAEANLDERKTYEDIDGIVIKARRNGSAVAADAIPVAKITGRISRDRRPVTTAWVSAVRKRAERKLPYVDILRGRIIHAEWFPTPSIAPSSTGRFVLELRNEDHWYVVVEEPNRAPTIVGPFEMKLNQTRELNIELAPGGAITGRVRGIPADSAGQWWVVAFDRGVWRAETRIAKDGSFRLDRLPAGEFGLKVGHDAIHDLGNPDHPSEEVMKSTADPWQGAVLVRVQPG